MSQTIQVKFPDGERQVPDHYQLDQQAFGSNWGISINRLVPDDQEGWEFRQVVGWGCVWVAVRCPM